MSKLKIASKLFPYNREVILGPAFRTLVDGIPTEESFKNIRLGLKYDPYSVELLLANMRTSTIIGDHAEALKSYYVLKQIAPSTVATVKLLNENLNK